MGIGTIGGSTPINIKVKKNPYEGMTWQGQPIEVSDPEADFKATASGELKKGGMEALGSNLSSQGAYGLFKKQFLEKSQQIQKEVGMVEETGKPLTAEEGGSKGIAPQRHTSGGSITEAYKTYDPQGAGIEQEQMKKETPFAKGFIPQTESGKEPAKDAMGGSVKGEAPKLHSEFHSFAEQKMDEMMGNAPVDTAKKSGFNTGVNTNWMSGY